MGSGVGVAVAAGGPPTEPEPGRNYTANERGSMMIVDRSRAFIILTIFVIAATLLSPPIGLGYGSCGLMRRASRASRSEVVTPPGGWKSLKNNIAQSFPHAGGPNPRKTRCLNAPVFGCFINTKTQFPDMETCAKSG